jgi:thioredoxin reductase
VSKPVTIIIGAGPYGLSLAAHLAARKVKHRIFGQPMSFWLRIAQAGGERYLKSYCFGANISKPGPGFSFADYNKPRGLETFEPCSIGDFASYGLWFQQKNVGWVEPNEVAHVAQHDKGFVVTLDDGECLVADRVVMATGLSHFADVPAVLASLPPALASHTDNITRFAAFKDRDIAVIGAGQSALEAAALLHEAGARPQLLVREDSILWQSRVSRQRSLWQRLRSPISGLGTGPRAWMFTNFPGAMHRLPTPLRMGLVKNYLPPEGAWWLRERVENRVPIHLGKTIINANETGGRVALRLRSTDGSQYELYVDHVVAGTGYDIDVERLELLHPKLRCKIQRLAHAPKLNATYESSASGLYFIGPASAMSFGPLFRFVVGAEYTAQVVSAHLASKAS